MVALGVKGLNYGIDFKGGTIVTIKWERILIKRRKKKLIKLLKRMMLMLQLILQIKNTIG
jgi:preprotein translocase subunit SecF